MRQSKTNQKLFSVLANTYYDNPKINLQQTDHIGAGFYATVFSVSNNKEFSFAQFNDGIANLTENKCAIEASSLYKVDDSIYRCVLVANSESIQYNDENLKEKGLHPIRANVFMDEDEVIWKLEGEGDTKRLVQDSKQDYGTLLEAKRSRNSVIASDNVYTPYQEHDYAYFFNHKTLAMDFGYVVARDNQDYVFSRQTKELTPIVASTQVVIADEPDRIKSPMAKKSEMIRSNKYTFNSYIDYLRQMYGADSPYYQAWEKAIKEHSIK